MATIVNFCDLIYAFSLFIHHLLLRESFVYGTQLGFLIMAPIHHL